MDRSEIIQYQTELEDQVEKLKRNLAKGSIYDRYLLWCQSEGEEKKSTLVN